MVTLAPEAIFYIGSVPITNTLIQTAIVDGVVAFGLIALNKQFKKVPGIFQNIVEIAVDGLYNLTESVSSNNAAKIFPWFMSFFTLILVANWIGLLPGYGTIGFYRGEEFIPFLRSAASDLNFTLGLALVAVITTQLFGIQALGFKEYIKRYVSLNPILLFVGILEALGIFTSIISLSFRLFGNILAGEAVLSTISQIFAFFVPLPFMALEIIVGLVQALVFGILTMAYMSIIMTPHNEGGEHA